MAEQRFDEVILVAPGSDYGRAMWADIAELPNGTLLDSALRPTGRLFTLLHHAHFSFAVNRRVQLPLQGLWRSRYSPETVDFRPERRYLVIYTDVSACRTDVGYLMGLHRRENLTLVLAMVNTMARRTGLIEPRLPAFDQVWTFDPGDAQRYGFHYHTSFYATPRDVGEDAIRTDAFFVGQSKGRAGLLAELHRLITEAGGVADFWIAHPEAGAPRAEGIHYNQWLSYAEALRHLRETNCVIEVMDGAQTGMTLRAMEATCYGRRLLTNNPAMRDTPWYQTGHIRVFDRPTPDDIAFILERGKVDYGYQGEFSAKRWVGEMEEMYHE